MSDNGRIVKISLKWVKLKVKKRIYKPWKENKTIKSNQIRKQNHKAEQRLSIGNKKVLYLDLTKMLGI